jgi:hypothetical protein
MSIEGMRVGWRALAPALDAFYDRAGGALLERQRLDEEQFSALDPLLGEMLEASAAIRREAEDELSEERIDGYQQTAELLLATATLDALLASDLARLEPFPQIAPTELPSLAEIFDGWTRERIERELELELPSPQEIFAEGQETLAQVAILFDAIPPLGGGEHHPRSRQALSGDARDAIVNLVELADGPGAELLRGFWAAASLGASGLLDAAERVEVLAKLQRSVEALVGRSPRFLREHVAKIARLCPQSWFVDEATSSLADRFSARSLLERVAQSQLAADRSRDWIANAPRLSWPAIDDLRRDLDELESRYRKHTKWIRKSARVLRFGNKPLAGVAVATLGPPGLVVLPGVFALGAGYVAYSLADRLDARELGVADLVPGVVRLVEARVSH